MNSWSYLPHCQLAVAMSLQSLTTIFKFYTQNRCSLQLKNNCLTFYACNRAVENSSLRNYYVGDRVKYYRGTQKNKLNQFLCSVHNSIYYIHNIHRRIFGSSITRRIYQENVGTTVFSLFTNQLVLKHAGDNVL